MIEEPNTYATEAGIKAGFVSTAIGIVWVKCLNEKGLMGLQDHQRLGRKPVPSQAMRSALVSLAEQKPETLGYPFKLWTLERLQTAFKEREGVHFSDLTIWKWVEAEGFEWKRQESWFHLAEKHDPDFVEKGSIVTAYLNPIPKTRLICVDEMDPIAVKTYPGKEWKVGPNRALLNQIMDAEANFG